MKEVLRFSVNIPAQVALRFQDGKHVEGRYGEQVMYSLVDDRVMYVPPIVEQRIRELGIAAGESFAIAKREMRSGTRKWIEWHIERVPPESEPERPAMQPELVLDPEDSPNEPVPPVNGTGKARANGKPHPGTNGHARNRSEPAEHTSANPKTDQEGEAQPPTLPATIPDTLSGPGARAMELALDYSAEIAQRIEARAAQRNFALRFSSEDIRAIGLTLFIQIMREGGLRWQQ